MKANPTTESLTFTKYQKMVMTLLAVIQFTIILDFMVISPLGAILMKVLSVKPSQFGLVVSVYAFSAGISGLLAAGFADKYDRKKLLVFFYIGFILGTLLCAIAPNYQTLLIARIVTGLFGGVVGSVSLAIVADLFPMQVRGRVMGFIQMSFAVSQVLGIPIGLLLANSYGWHAPFMMLVGLGLLVLLGLIKVLKPVNEHLLEKVERNALKHLGKTITKKYYVLAFATTALLSIGGFMLMPFSTAFLVNNVKITQEQLPWIFMITGLGSMIFLPMIGKFSDKVGKYSIFTGGTIVAMVMVTIYTNLSVTSLWSIIVINVILFAALMSRMIPSTALMTAIPSLQDRGAFMGINSSIQQIAGGVASIFAGLIVVQQNGGILEHFDTLGYICSGVMVICLCMMYFINKIVSSNPQPVVPIPVEL